MLRAASVLSSALSVLPCEGRQNVIQPPCSATDALTTLTKLKPQDLSSGWLYQRMSSRALSQIPYLLCFMVFNSNSCKNLLEWLKASLHLLSQMSGKRHVPAQLLSGWR